MKSLIGKVVSTKMQKTVVVQIERRFSHPLYNKVIRRTKNYKAHNEKFDLKEGNMVKIVPCRPMSGDKHWKVSEVFKKN